VGELGVFKLFDGGEMPVDEAGVGERPEVLGRLEFGGVRRQEEQVDVLGDAQARTGVPAGAVQDEHDLRVRPGAHRFRELGQFHLEEGDRDARGQMEDRATGGGMDEADDVAPSEAVAHAGDRTPADGGPDPSQQRLQADTVLVSGPEFHAGPGERGGYRPQQRAHVFLKAACCAASAWA